MFNAFPRRLRLKRHDRRRYRTAVVAGAGLRATATFGPVRPFGHFDGSYGIDRKEKVAPDVDTNGFAYGAGLTVDTRDEGEILDMWHFKGMRNAQLGWVDDQYTDHTRYDKDKSPNAGRKGDPGGPDYAAFSLENGKPKFMDKSGRAANAGGKYWIARGDEVPFDDSKFKAGDEVAAYIVEPLKGDRGDVKVAFEWKNGVHTSVISRKLVTGSKFDVQWNDLGKRYAFGFAAFDNAQVRHATADEPSFLVFGK